jgi:glycosyltransferase involved in cell wall biosynthesis
MKYLVPISIVMPCYNCDKFVSVAIESIIKQSFENFELIIVNDGSTDNSHVEIIKHIDKRIKYIKIQSNKGNNCARILEWAKQSVKSALLDRKENGWMKEVTKVVINLLNPLFRGLS